MRYFLQNMVDLRYPIGRFEVASPPDTEKQITLQSELREMPSLLRSAIADLSDGQLDTPYRPQGWTVRQVVHHLADSHMNWYVRTKLALTDEAPLVNTYDENKWAELHDARTAPVEPSLLLLDALHQRWVYLFRSLTQEQWKRRILHPERGVFVLDTALAMHVWHGHHHIGHILELRKRMGWTAATG